MFAILRSELKYLNYGRTMCSVSSSLTTKLLAQHSVTKFDEALNNIDGIERNLSARCSILALDLCSVRKLYSIYCKAAARRKCFKNADDCNSYEARQFESLDVYLKHLKPLIFEYLLALPNKLHERTPLVKDAVILTKSDYDFTNITNDHVQVGTELKVLRYEDPVTYYFQNDAAVFELAIIRFLSDTLQNKRNFKQFRNPDTCNSFVLKGVVVEELPRHAFLVQNSHHVLVGSASLSLFCAVRVDTSTHVKFMPEKFFVCGRIYEPRIKAQNGLFGVCQRTCVNVFVTTSSVEQMWLQFDELLAWLIELYEGFRVDFRVCYARAATLTPAECCRAIIQLYSRQEGKYVDAARLSVYDSFLSQRLNIRCHNVARETGLVYIVDGVVVSVPILVACLLERSHDHLLIPDCIRPYMRLERAA